MKNAEYLRISYYKKKFVFIRVFLVLYNVEKKKKVSKEKLQ